MTIDMEKVNPDVLAAALRAIGATNVMLDGGTLRAYMGTSTVRWQGGKLVVQGLSDADIEGVSRQVKKAYTAEAFKTAANKAGFKVQVTTDGRLLATRTRYGG